MTPMDMTGETFGRLVVIRRSPGPEKNSYWICRCECGNVKRIMGLNMKRGLTKSCGCLNRELASDRGTQHGHTGKANRGKWTTEYRIWSAMKRRCYNQNCPAFPDYGGRGILVCDRWRNSFESFYEDMGSRPSGMTLDRIDNDGNYEPGNCRWATRITQANNARSNVKVMFDGKQMTLSDACRASGVPMTTVVTRRLRGWPDTDWFLPRMPGKRRRPRA